MEGKDNKLISWHKWWVEKLQSSFGWRREEKPPSARTITLKQNEPSQPPKDEEEELPDLNDPDLADAATKIQAAFRGHKTRIVMKQDDKGKAQAEAQKKQQEQQNLEEEFRSDDVELTHAATKIQASFRGHMARKEIEKKVDTKPHDPTPAEEEVDIDLTDPDLHKAATKIQASFRGHAVRKEKEGTPAAGTK